MRKISVKAQTHTILQPETTKQTRVKIIEGEDKLILCCGKSAIELHPDGKILLKGRKILQSADDNITLLSKKIELN